MLKVSAGLYVQSYWAKPCNPSLVPLGVKTVILRQAQGSSLILVCWRAAATKKKGAAGRSIRGRWRPWES
jgi:hypothetical protein